MFLLDAGYQLWLDKTWGRRAGRLEWARRARLKDQPLYMWHGPSVPMVGIATGRMPDN